MAEKEKKAAPAPAPAAEPRYRVVLGQMGRWPEGSVVGEAALRAANVEIERLLGMGILARVEA